MSTPRAALSAFLRGVSPRKRERLWLRPSAAMWVLLALGLGLRCYLVTLTEGTYDVRIWAEHASGVRELGLVGYYRSNLLMNHPPFMGIVAAGLLALAESLGISFGVLLRLPFALLDALTALLLLWALRDHRGRFLLVTLYWLHPLSVIFSAYHGNTDSVLPLFVLGALVLAASGRPGAAGAALGLSLWIKLPGALAIPALALGLRSWRDRAVFVSALAGVGLLSFVPILFADPEVLIRNVFGYRGQMIQTTAGMPVWGMRMFLPFYYELGEAWRGWLYEPIRLFFEYNSLLTLGLVGLVALLRAGRCGLRELAWTVVAGLTILYGLSLNWSFQYFAWSLPLWFLVSARFSLPASLLASGYIYGLYAFLCGDPALRGEWDFIGNPQWPAWLRAVRNLAQLFFFFAAWAFVGVAIAQAVREARNRWQSGRASAARGR